MTTRLTRWLPAGYPRQMWILFWGSLISIMGQSLVWPFLTIHIRQQLDVPLTQITLLFTLQSLATMVATAVAGPAVDRFGRKWVMVLGPVLSGITQIAMARADSYGMWAVLLMLYASSGVLFMLGSRSMIADMIPSEQRTEAYALLRMAANTGIAVGPAVGGFVISVSYAISFYVAATVQILLSIATLVLIRETLTPELKAENAASTGGQSQGYGPLFRDTTFMSFWGVYLLVEIAASLVFTLLSVYVKEQYQIPESQFGFIIGTNATMVVLFQYAITRITKRYRPLSVMAISAVFYAAGMAIFAAGSSFWVFWFGMVVMTTGELLLAPTSTALVADLAPPDMRGRYMGVYGLSYRVGGGVGPVIGGWLNDHIYPAATWWFGMTSCLFAAGGFLWLRRVRSAQYTPAHSPLK
ncbi:MAG: MFS transporter [Anaerolineae bacterium]